MNNSREQCQGKAAEYEQDDVSFDYGWNAVRRGSPANRSRVRERQGFAGGNAAGSCLVQRDNILTGDSGGSTCSHAVPVLEQVEIRAAGCKCRFCPSCSVSQALQLREPLRAVVRQWSAVKMITLTMNRDRFGHDAKGAEAAYLYVTQNSLIGQFVRKLRRRGLVNGPHYFAVMEPHPQSPEWVHWHVLVQASWIEFDEVWKSWQEFADEYKGEERHKNQKPPFGRVDIAPDRNKSTGKPYTSDQVVNYLSGYLCKLPASGWPAWLRKRSKVNLYSTSKGFWSKHGVPSPSGHSSRREIEPETPKRSRRPDRSINERIAECRESCHVFALTTDIDKRTGEITEHRQWKGTVHENLAGIWGCLAEYVKQDTSDFLSGTRLLLADVAGVWQGLCKLDWFRWHEQEWQNRILTKLAIVELLDKRKPSAGGDNGMGVSESDMWHSIDLCS